jgi:hypothetical protein
MTATLAPFASHHRPNTVSATRRDLLLLLMVGTMVMMPVTYRAGTDQAHVHTIFQGMVDTLLGTPHHHPNHHEGGAAPSPFSPPGIPLRTIDGHHTTTATDADSDTPQQVELAGPALATTALLQLSSLVATLLAGWKPRPLWNSSQELSAIPARPEAPPPR